MTGLLVACIVLLSATIILMIVGMGICIRRLGGTAREMEDTLRTVREEVLPLAADLKRVLGNADTVFDSAQAEVERVSRITESIEHLVGGKTVVDAAGKAASTSKATVVSVLEGLRQGLKTLRGKRESDG